MLKFYQPIDKRSRKALTEYLTGHFRYDTMNSWNRSTSYACNMKIYNLDLDNSITDRLYRLIQTDEFFEPLRDLIQDFGDDHNYEWQAGINGRSGGYLVLYQGAKKPSGYKSYCTLCGQKNYKSVAESGNVCGRCHEPARHDFTTTHMNVISYPGRGTDEYEDFEDWAMDDLRKRAELVQDFDRLADAIIQESLYIAKNFEVEQETYYVEQKRPILVERA